MAATQPLQPLRLGVGETPNWDAETDLLVVGFFSAGAWRHARLGIAPRTATIGCRSIRDCIPVSRW